MKELLQKLLAAEILTEETKAELQTAFSTQLTEEIEKARADATASVTAQLNEQWITERETLIEALDSKVTELLNEELKDLKGDIERLRDLEAVYANKLVESKAAMATQLKSDVDTLVEKLDAFLEVRLTTEMEELRENINEVAKNDFGKKIFEAFVGEFKKHYAGDDSAESKLVEAQARLDDTLTVLEKTEKKIAQLERTNKIRDVLTPLGGRSREIMEAILKNVDTPLIEDAYKTYIGRVLKESTTEKKSEVPAEKEDKVLAEGKNDSQPTDKVEGKTVSGDKASDVEDTKLVTESVVTTAQLSKEQKEYFRRMGGIA